MSKKRRRLGRAQRAKISRALKRYHQQQRAKQAARSRAAKAGWRTRRARKQVLPAYRKSVKAPKRVLVPPPLPEAPPNEFELTRVAETRRRRSSETVQVDQTLRFVRKRGARMTPEEAREWLARGKYGPVLAAFDVEQVDWTNEGDRREHTYTAPKDIEAALDQSARMGWRYGPVREF